MWDSYIGFMDKLKVGYNLAWWEQHNEHRILLARLFFWLDLECFNGQGIFLIFSNLLALASTVGMFIWWARQLVKAIPEKRLDSLLVFSSIIFFCSSWIQNENLTWGFQIQFILAQLIPLISFYFMSVYATDSSSKKNLFLAYLFGILSLLSMGNGVLVLPLLLIQMLFLRLPYKTALSFALAIVPAFTVYFIGYQSIAGHDSISRVLREDLLGLISYVAVYFGGPIHHLLGLGSLTLYLSGALGVLFLALSLYKLVGLFRGKLSPLYTGLLFFLSYLIVSGVGTGGSRLIFGLSQALSSRYQTPVLFAWVTLGLLYLPELSRLKWKTISFIALIALGTVFLDYNRRGAFTADSNDGNKGLAVLALSLGVFDRNAFLAVYPSPESLFERFKEMRSPTFISLNGYLPRSLHQDLGTKDRAPISDCDRSLSHLKYTRLDSDSVKVFGEISETEDPKRSPYFLAVKDGQVLGAVTPHGKLSKRPLELQGYARFKDDADFQNLTWICKGSI
jgi:hypothetical protein